MSTPTPTELLAFLQEHRFLSPSQSQQLAGDRFTKYADSQLLARDLIDRKLLTAYQANQLLQGKGSDLLLGPYRLVRRLGEGGMGQVFKARHVSMDRMVALKIIPKETVSNPLVVSRFQREARAVAKLSHPNIVGAYEVNQIGETHYLAMEYVRGIDLARLVQQSGPLAILQACEYARQVAIGLQHAHEKGLVHRDIKPGNLMVVRPRSDEPPVIKILDFGLARFESESERTTRLTQLGQAVGTVDYVAPEQSQNSRMVDIRSDIYSLGCSLFYLLTGNPPFPGDDAAEKINARVYGDVPSVRKSRPEVSPDLEQVLAKMTARNPDDRYQTPREVAEALKPHREEGETTLSRSATLSDRPVVHAPKQRTVAIAHHRTTAQPEAEFPPMQTNGGLEQSKRAKATVWITLAGAMALSVAIIGAIAFAITHDTGITRKEQEQLAGPGKTSIKLPPEQLMKQSHESTPDLKSKEASEPKASLDSGKATTPPLQSDIKPENVVLKNNGEKPINNDPQLQTAIDHAINSGVAYLKKTQQKNGTWANPRNNWKEATIHQHVYEIGFTALPGLTLLECGVPASDPIIQQAAQFVRSKAAKLDQTYELSLAILFLDRLGDPEDKKIIQTFALRLIAGQSATGGWGYKCPPLNNQVQMELLTALRHVDPLADDKLGSAEQKAKKSSETKPDGEADTEKPSEAKAEPRKSTKPYTIPARIKVLPVMQDPALQAMQDPLDKSNDPFLTTTDNSNTQFAILALWRAQQYGVPMKRSLNLIVRRYQTSQNADGSWGYHYRFGGGADRIAHQWPNAMTCVGLIGLAVGHGLAQPRPAGQVAQDARIINGLISLSNSIGQPVEHQGKVPMMNLYFLWSLERVAVLYNLPTIGDRDWYRWGAQILVRNQAAEGNWAGGLYIGTCPPLDTCLALLFLKRANLVKDLTAKLPFSADDLNNSIVRKSTPAPENTEQSRQAKETNRLIEPARPAEPKKSSTNPKTVTAPKEKSDPPQSGIKPEDGGRKNVDEKPINIDPQVQADIDKAVDGGVAYLKRTQEKNGSWAGPSERHTVGYAALPGAVLLECGVPSEDQVIRRAAEVVRRDAPKLDFTYEIALSILFLDRLGDAKDHQLIQTLAVRLIAGQMRTGGWTYGCPIVSEEMQKEILTALRKLDSPEVPASLKKLPVFRDPEQSIKQLSKGRPIDSSDNSNTQFALLALWAAQRHDVPARRSMQMIVRRFQSSQNLDGGWGYGYSLDGGIPERPAMSCVGLLGLAVGQGIAPDARAGDDFKPTDLDRIRAGFAVLSKNVGKPTGTRRNLPLKDLYFLWSVERVAVLYSLTTIGDKDWYRWGAEMLIANQQKRGFWTGGGYPGSSSTIDTCLALLFLKRTNFVADLTAKLRIKPEDLNRSIIRATQSRSPGENPNPAKP